MRILTSRCGSVRSRSTSRFGSRRAAFQRTGKSYANMGYVTREVTFVAGGNTTTLGFASTVGGAYGPVIDDVRVETCRPCGCSQ